MKQGTDNTPSSRLRDWALSIAVVGALVYSVGGLANVLASSDRGDHQAARSSAAETNEERASPDRSEIQKVFGPDAEVVSLKHLSGADIKTMQRKLAEMGHYDGAIDGLVSSQIRDALRSFTAKQAEVSRQLLQDYQVTTPTLDVLGVEHSNVPPAEEEEHQQ